MTTNKETGGEGEMRVKGLQTETRNPLEIADEIKALFRSEGSTDFDSFFDLAYPRVAEMGGVSVVARDAEGNVIMHLGAFPRAFRREDDRFSGGLLGDLMVAQPYRDFWSAVHFFRQAVDLLVESRQYDFLYTDPQEVSFALVRAGGFEVLDSMRRFVLPLVPGWLSVLRLRAPIVDLTARQVPWHDGTHLLAHQDRLASGSAFRVHRSRLFYQSRAWVQITDRSEWTVLDLPESETTQPPVGLVLTTPLPPNRTLSVMDVLWDDRRVNLESVLYAAAAQGRVRGYRKIGIRALDRSLLGKVVRKCGFIPRNDDQPVLAKALREDVRLPPVEDWLLTWIDGSTW